MIYEDLINATVEYVKLKDDILNTIFNFIEDKYCADIHDQFEMKFDITKNIINDDNHFGIFIIKNNDCIYEIYKKSNQVNYSNHAINYVKKCDCIGKFLIPKV
jgi:hypothetical protein